MRTSGSVLSLDRHSRLRLIVPTLETWKAHLESWSSWKPQKMSNLCCSKWGRHPAAWEAPRELAGNAASGPCPRPAQLESVWTRFSGDERHMKVSRSAALISLPLFILKEDEFGGLSQVVKSAPYRHGAGWGPLLLHCWSCWATVSHMIRQLFQALLWLLLSCLHHIFTQFIAKSKMTFL